MSKIVTNPTEAYLRRAVRISVTEPWADPKPRYASGLRYRCVKPDEAMQLIAAGMEVREFEAGSINMARATFTMTGYSVGLYWPNNTKA